MSPRRTPRQLVVAVLVGVLVGGGLLAVTPAGAEVSQIAATNWKKIWKKNLKPLADKRYYTKAQSNAAYQPKGSYEPAGSGYSKAETYSKAEADAKYSAAGSSYSKAESDAKYLPKPALIRGQYDAIGAAGAAGDWVGDNITYGVTLSAPPTPHYIPVGGALPVGCSGTAASPNASPGHLCLFEVQNINVATRFIFDAATGAGGSAGTFGSSMYVASAAAGDVFVYGSWAVRPVALTTPARAGRSDGDPAPLGAPAVP